MFPPPPAPTSETPLAARQVREALHTLYGGPEVAAESRQAADAHLRTVLDQPAVAIAVASALLAEHACQPADAQESQSSQCIAHFCTSALARHAHFAPEHVHTLAFTYLASAASPATTGRAGSAWPTAAVPALCRAAAPHVVGAACDGTQSFSKRLSAIRDVAHCHADEAVAAEAVRIADMSPQFAASIGATCAAEVSTVLAHASNILLAHLCNSQGTAGAGNPASFRAFSRTVLSAVACIRAWTPYAVGTVGLVELVISPLLNTLAHPKLATDASVALGELIEGLVGRADALLDISVIMRVVDGLRQVYTSASESRTRAEIEASSANTDSGYGSGGNASRFFSDDWDNVCHAVAEVCVYLADSLADILLCTGEPATLLASCPNTCKAAASDIVRLSVSCLADTSERTFQAALDACCTWTATSCVTVDSSLRATVTEVLPVAVQAVMMRLDAIAACRHGMWRSAVGGGNALFGTLGHNTPADGQRSPSQFSANSMRKPRHDLGDSEYLDDRLLRASLEMLHQCAQALSVPTYVQILRSTLPSEASLIALSAAGDVPLSETEIGLVVDLLPEVVSLTVQNAAQGGMCQSAAVRSAATRALTAFAHVLVSSRVSDDCVAAALTAACVAVPELGREPALLLLEVAEEAPLRVVPLLPHLIGVSQAALQSEPLLPGSDGLAMAVQPGGDNDIDSDLGKEVSAAEILARGLAHAASELESEDARADALFRILRHSLRLLQGTVVEQTQQQSSNSMEPLALAPMRLAHHLRIIAACAEAVNDCNLTITLLASLSSVLSPLSHSFAGDPYVGRCIAVLLEKCVSPDREDPDSSWMQRRREAKLGEVQCPAWASSVVSSIQLVSDAFSRSGPHGEASWLLTIAKLSGHLLGAERRIVSDHERITEANVWKECLSVALQRTLQSMSQFAGIANLPSRPDLLHGFLSFALYLLTSTDKTPTRVGLTVIEHSVEACAQVALLGLRAAVPIVSTAAPASATHGTLVLAGASGIASHSSTPARRTPYSNTWAAGTGTAAAAGLTALQWWHGVLCDSDARVRVAARALSSVGGGQAVCEAVLWQAVRAAPGAGARRMVKTTADVLCELAACNAVTTTDAVVLETAAAGAGGVDGLEGVELERLKGELGRLFAGGSLVDRDVRSAVRRMVTDERSAMRARAAVRHVL